jgi:hypothetical protein
VDAPTTITIRNENREIVPHGRLRMTSTKR